MIRYLIIILLISACKEKPHEIYNYYSPNYDSSANANDTGGTYEGLIINNTIIVDDTTHWTKDSIKNDR